MKRILYLDAFSGLSGNMILGSLLELGVDLKALQEAMRSLNLSGWTIKAERVKRRGLSGTHFEVIVDEQAQPHRSYADICRIIDASSLSLRVREMAKSIFEVLATAESNVHLQSITDVHFHEVGAVDSIIDIVGTVWCLHELKVDQLRYSALPIGRGWTMSAHGRIPLPAPATLEILQGLEIVDAPPDMEWVTPTGAAITRTIGSQALNYPEGQLLQVGVGAGTQDPDDRPNLLRACLFQELAPSPKVIVVETNLDDLSAEEIGFLLSQLWALSPLDVWVTPILMKKNRPGQMVSVLCKRAQRAAVVDCLYEHSSTFGVRFAPFERDTLARRQVSVATPYGDVAVKLGYRDDRLLNRSPEYVSCAEAAKLNGVSIG